MKRLFFLDHSFYDVEEPYCRGCFMEQNSDKLPEHIKPLGMVVVGYADGEPQMPERFEPNKIHYEKY